MSRLSFRPRPLDIHKKLPIVKSFKDFEDDETPASTRNSYFHRIVAEADIEVQHVTAKKILSEIPTPQFVIVDTYERDYSRTFNQPNSYLRARGARAEIGEFVEYDLDNEDEDWLEELNKEKKLLSPEMFELIMFKLEVFDHKARERAGIITPTFGSPILALLQFDSAFEALQALPNISVRYGVFQSIYSYWKEKRDRWQKPVLRRLQPPPPVNDTNPYNVFRPREKTHRLHTRRMQRRENNVQSFEKLRQVRRNLDQAKILLDALIKREEKKREVMESEVSLQRIQIKYKDEAELLEDSLAMPGFPSFIGKFGSSEDEFVDSDGVANSRSRGRHLSALAPSFTNSRSVMVSGESTRQDFRHRNGGLGGWLKNLDPLEPVLLFTKPLDPEKLAAVGIIPPTNPSSIGTSPSPTNPSSTGTSPSENSFNIRGRIGRGGRLIFDRWNPSVTLYGIRQIQYHTPIDFGDSLYALPRKRP